MGDIVNVVGEFDIVGVFVGLGVGVLVGVSVGGNVGDLVGEDVGISDGAALTVGDAVVGENDGA
jgi:hypothetical protein